MSTTRSDDARPVSLAYVREIFRYLESGDGKEFFDHVAEDVDWIVEGTHPLAGHYRSKSWPMKLTERKSAGSWRRLAGRAEGIFLLRISLLKRKPASTRRPRETRSPSALRSATASMTSAGVDGAASK